MPKQTENYYSILGILRSATQKEIRRAYLKAAKRLHPDTNVAPGETEMFLEAQQAYQVLSNQVLRAEYDKALPEADDDLAVIKHHIILSRNELTHLQENQIIYMLMELEPAENTEKALNSAPLNICLVLDCSTSMKGEKLDTAKAATLKLISKLKPQDIFSVVAFSDRAEVVIPATRQANALKMENQIRFLQPGGGTEILQGLLAGFEEVQRYGNPNTNSQIILLTDGCTYGDEDACYDLARNAALHRIGISGMGIGSGWNDAFLDRLTSLTGGHSMLVSQANEIERLLTERFTKLSNIFAETVSLEYELGNGVEINYAFRLKPETDAIISENPLRLGPILNTSPISILVELTVHPRAPRERVLNLMKGRLVISGAAMQPPEIEIPVNLSVDVKDTGILASPDQAIIDALSKLTLYRIQEKARIEVRNGDHKKAAKHLQTLATNLLSQGERSLAKTIIFEIEKLEKEKTYSEHGEKKIKYGTRALVLSGEGKS